MDPFKNQDAGQDRVLRRVPFFAGARKRYEFPDVTGFAKCGNNIIWPTNCHGGADSAKGSQLTALPLLPLRRSGPLRSPRNAWEAKKRERTRAEREAETEDSVDDSLGPLEV